MRAQPSPYNKRTEMSDRIKNTLVLTKQFDDGLEIAVLESHSSFHEYDIMDRGLEAHFPYATQKGDEFIEYDIFSKGLDLTYITSAIDLDFKNEGYIEPFGDFDDSIINDSRPVRACFGRSVSIEPPYSMQWPQGKDQITGEIPDVVLKHEIADDDFMSDLKSILNSQKVYDPFSKKTIDKSSLPAQKPWSQEKSRTNEVGGEELNPLYQKNEHEIFDRIAQSMSYANAYDLGSVALEKRFREFDEIMEIEENNKKKGKEIGPSAALRYEDDRIIGTEPPSNEDFIEDLNIITNKGDVTYQSPSLPPGPQIIGRSIGEGDLQEGDIIISTTSDKNSKLMENAVGSEISHSIIYTGNGTAIEAVPDGVIEGSLNSFLMSDIVAVAYRHINMSPEKAQHITDFLKTAKESKAKSDNWSLVRIAPSQIISNYCSHLRVEEQEACKKQARNFKSGTDINNEFYCSDLIFRALKDVGLGISEVEPSWSRPQEVIRLNHNGTLLYIGHLKV